MKDGIEKVLDRVKKLMAVANDSRANPKEAANAATMAAKMMAKYQLEESDIILAELNDADNLAESVMQPRMGEWDEPQIKIPMWANLLSGKISRLTECRAVIGYATLKFGRPEAVIKFQGYSADVALAEYMMNFIVATMRRLRAEFKQGFTYKTKGISSIRNYNKGLLIGICEVIDAEISAKEAEAAQTTSSNALVVAKTRAIVDKFGGVIESSAVTISEDGVGFRQGVEDGSKVVINKPLPAPTQNETLLLGE